MNDQYRYEFADYRNEMWLETFQVTKVTPQGLWLNVYGKQKFVLSNAAKKWAYPHEGAGPSLLQGPQDSPDPDPDSPTGAGQSGPGGR